MGMDSWLLLFKRKIKAEFYKRSTKIRYNKEDKTNAIAELKQQNEKLGQNLN